MQPLGVSGVAGDRDGKLVRGPCIDRDALAVHGLASCRITVRATDSSATLEPIPSGLPEDIEHAMRQRQLFGLRSDLAWVQQVAADPRARMEALDFPMLPEEEAEFGSRQHAYEAAVEVIERYAASHVDQFGGVYTDQPNHVVVSLWTHDPDGHLAELNKLGAVAKIIVARQVRWSERELRTVQDQIDWGWFSEVDAKGEGVGADIVRNVVEIDISSANPDAPRHIVEHYVGCAWGSHQRCST